MNKTDRINVRADFSMKDNLKRIRFMLEDKYCVKFSDSQCIEWLLGLGLEVLESELILEYFK